MLNSLVIVIKDVISSSNEYITNFCQVVVYQNGELLESSTTRWDTLEANDLLDLGL